MFLVVEITKCYGLTSIYTGDEMFVQHALDGVARSESRRISNFFYELGIATSLLPTIVKSYEGRKHSLPFVSGDTFRSVADHLLDETASLDPYRVRYGDILFVKGDLLPKFCGLLNQISQGFILIIHNSDASAPGDFAEILFSDHNVLAIFAQNPSARHPKLFPIPIGLANNRWTHGRLSDFLRLFPQTADPLSRARDILLSQTELIAIGHGKL